MSGSEFYSVHRVSQFRWFIAGTPIPVKYIKGKGGRLRLSEEAKNWKEIIRRSILVQDETLRGLPLFKCPIGLVAVVLIPRPETKKDMPYPICKPDAKNYLVPIEDALSNFIYKDDCVIVDTRCIKRWADVRYMDYPRSPAGAEITLNIYKPFNLSNEE